MASVFHSINRVLWGSTGIVVDGISVPDSGCFQQLPISEVGPGARLPDPSNPLIVLKEGPPVLASTTIGAALHQATVQNIVNVPEFGMDPKSSLDQANTRGPFYGMSVTGAAPLEYKKEAIGKETSRTWRWTAFAHAVRRSRSSASRIRLATGLAFRSIPRRARSLELHGSGPPSQANPPKAELKNTSQYGR